MLESTDFYYDGILASTMGVINCQVQNGLYEETFLANKNIKEVKIRGKSKPYYFGCERDNLSFKLTFAFENPWDDAGIRAVARWLHQDEFKPFYTVDHPNRIYYCQPIGDSNLTHNGLKQGYIQLEFYCDDSYSYMPSATPTFTSATPTFTIDNTSDLTIKPEIEITKTVGAGNVTITNVTNNNQSFTFTGLVLNEVVYLNCDTEVILTDLSDTYRYSAFSGDFIELLRGENNFTITGNCTIQFRYQGKLLQGGTGTTDEDEYILDGGVF